MPVVLARNEIFGRSNYPRLFKFYPGGITNSDNTYIEGVGKSREGFEGTYIFSGGLFCFICFICFIYFIFLFYLCYFFVLSRKTRKSGIVKLFL